MNQLTPAIQIRPNDLAANGRALSQLLAKLQGKTIRTVLDVRYGLGGWARLVADVFPEASITGYEADSETYEAAWKGNNTCVANERWPARPQLVDLLLADF